MVERIQPTTSKEKAEIFEIIMPLLKALYEEFRELSKKKPDAKINETKINISNRLLEKSRIVLANESTIDYLILLEKDLIPSNDDVVIIMSQYMTAMNKFKKDYFNYEANRWRT